MQAEIELVINQKYQPAIVNGLQTNQTIESLVSPGIAQSVYDFHQTLPGYRITPTLSLQSLADKSQIKRLWVKDGKPTL